MDSSAATFESHEDTYFGVQNATVHYLSRGDSFDFQNGDVITNR